MLVKMDCSVV
uniref:Uncharacterized protein n=1 Tax=Anguilla anguilla TaxID=7936 RepID=A0A0E9T8I4_ANGAN